MCVCVGQVPTAAVRKGPRLPERRRTVSRRRRRRRVPRRSAAVLHGVRRSDLRLSGRLVPVPDAARRLRGAVHARPLSARPRRLRRRVRTSQLSAGYVSGQRGLLPHRLGRPLLPAGRSRSLRPAPALRLRRRGQPIGLRRRRRAGQRRRRRHDAAVSVRAAQPRLAPAGRRLVPLRPARSGADDGVGRSPPAAHLGAATALALSARIAQRQQLQVHQPFDVGLFFRVFFFSSLFRSKSVAFGTVSTLTA